MAPMSLKFISLAVLVVQNTALVLIMRYSRTREGPRYLASTAVAMMEVLKLITCCVVVYMECGSLLAFSKKLRIETIGKPKEMMKLSVPSLLYTVQNNLLYIALSNLEAATYQVIYQTKILTTAVFFVVMLKKRLSMQQWLSLVMLAAGIALAEMTSHPTASTDAGGAVEHHQQNHSLGVCCVLAAACTSGFAGVYFEMMLKGGKASLWIRNIQMGLPSVIIAFASVFLVDSAAVAAQGFFFGYSGLVVAVIVLQAIGGLVVAVVVKYADNILKGFAAGASIITSCILSAYFFNFEPGPTFVLGACLVVLSTYLYGNFPPPKPARGASFREQGLPTFQPSHNVRQKV